MEKQTKKQTLSFFHPLAACKVPAPSNSNIEEIHIILAPLKRLGSDIPFHHYGLLKIWGKMHPTLNRYNFRTL